MLRTAVSDLVVVNATVFLNWEQDYRFYCFKVCDREGKYWLITDSLYHLSLWHDFHVKIKEEKNGLDELIEGIRKVNINCGFVKKIKSVEFKDECYFIEYEKTISSLKIIKVQKVCKGVEA